MADAIERAKLRVLESARRLAYMQALGCDFDPARAPGEQIVNLCSTDLPDHITIARNRLEADAKLLVQLEATQHAKDGVFPTGGE